MHLPENYQPLIYSRRQISSADYLAAAKEDEVQNVIGPHNVLLQVNYACYLHCEMCDRHEWVKNGAPTDETLTTNELFELIDEFSEMGTRRVTLVGTEPVMRKDLPLILEKIRSTDIKPELYTAGIVLSDEVIHSAIASSSDVAFSLDGFRAESHNGIRVPDRSFDAFKTTVQSANRLSSARSEAGVEKENVRITANFTLQRWNIGDLRDVTPEQIDSLGFDVLRMSVVHGKDSYSLDSSDIPAIVAFMKKIKQNPPSTEISFSDSMEYLDQGLISPLDFDKNSLIPTAISDGTRKLKCHIADYSTMIDPRGDVRPCLYLYDDNGPFSASDRDQYVLGNVKEYSFRQVWNNEAYTAFRKSTAYPNLEPNSRCRTCEYFQQFQAFDEALSGTLVNLIEIGW